MRRTRFSGFGGSFVLGALAVLLAVLLGALPASAQVTGGGGHSFDNKPSARSGTTQKQLEGVGLDEHLGEHIPQNLVFRNEQGRKVELGDFFDGERPVILTLNYHNCKQLCGIQLRSFARKALKGQDKAPGSNFEVVTVDFNPREGPADARRAKKRYLKLLGKEGAGAGWHFLTMTEGRGGRRAIRALTRAVGFKYHWVAPAKQFAHPAAYIFISGEGKITRYLAGLKPKARATHLALVEAGNGTVGNLAEQIYLSCCNFDIESGTYVASAWQFMKVACSFVLFLLLVTLVWLWRLEKGSQEGWEEKLAAREW